MNKQIWKIAASLVVAATVIGVIGIVQNGDQGAYAFEQTVAAMQGKRFFHIQTYYASPTKRHDEFWAEFNEHGKLIRLRQSDQWKRESHPVEVLWDNGLEYQYRPNRWGGTLVIRKTKRHEDANRLEEFDPEMMIEEAYMDVEKGRATVKVDDSRSPDGNLVVEIKGDRIYGGLMVLQVDPITKLVLRMDLYDDEEDDEGNYFIGDYRKGIEVLEYNQPFDSKLFDPNHFMLSFEDAVIIDQVSEPVGVAEGDLLLKDLAFNIARQALEAWAADDYETAGMLFGRAPKEYFERRASYKPVADIVISEVNPIEWYGPKFKVRCNYLTEQSGELITMNAEFRISNEGQPGRWYIDPEIAQFWAEE